MVRLLGLGLVLLSVPAHADPPIARLGATAGFQQTDRSAWVFGPSAEVHVHHEFSIRGEAQLELGDFGDPFGPSNIRGGPGPHVNHVLFGPTWRPERYAPYALAVGAELGILVMHSVYAEEEFTKTFAGGAFVQAGRVLGPVELTLQLRLDVSPTIDMAAPDGSGVPTTTARLNLAFEVPIRL